MLATERVVLPDSGMRNYLRRPPANSVLYLPGLDYDNWHTGTIRDYSGRGNNGTITEALTVKLPSGLYVLHYDGTDDGTNCGSAANLDNLTELWWHCWLYRDVTSDVHVLMTKQVKHLQIFSDDTMRGTIAAVTQSAESRSNETVGALVWTCLDMTYSFTGDKKVHMYKNGAECAYSLQNASIGGLTDESGEDFIVGRYKSGGLETDGMIGIPFECSAALGAATIADRYSRERTFLGV